MPISPRALLLPFLLFLLLSGKVTAEEGAVPYAALHARFAPADILADYPRLRGVQRVSSRLQQVRPEQIQIWIEAASGRIDVPIDRDGRARFPLTEQLLQENPWVRSNQPQGSLQLQLSLEVYLPETKQVGYAEIWQDIEQAQAALDRLGPEYVGSQVVGIEYQFLDGPGQVLLSGRNIELSLLADQHGRVMLRRDPDWLAAEVQVRFDGTLASALPRLR